jgi:dihydrofolate reductase
MTQLSIIVAMDSQRGIGIDNTLPWKLPEDMAHFKRLTTGHPIVMGRKTFDSIGRPLPGRRNIVVTRNPDWRHDGVETASSVEAAVALVAGQPAFIIGGADIYAQAMAVADQLIVTEVKKTYNCDAFFPPIDPLQWRESEREELSSPSADLQYAFVTWCRQPAPAI